MADYYFYNTDGKSLVEPRPRFRTLNKKGFAATGGEGHFGEKLGRLAPGDTLLMYENRIGVVAVGTVLERWDGKSHDSLWYYVSADEIGEDGHEYRIKVDWFLDLSRDPIDLRQLKKRLGFLPRGTIRKIITGRNEVARLIAEQLQKPIRFLKCPDPILGESIKTPPARMQCTTTRIIRDTAESRWLKELYEYRCQICRERIEFGFGAVTRRCITSVRSGESIGVRTRTIICSSFARHTMPCSISASRRSIPRRLWRSAGRFIH